MSSTNKTSLGLNMWEASDKPVRQDFVNDNVIIDEKVTKLEEDLSNSNIVIDEKIAKLNSNLTALESTSGGTISLSGGNAIYYRKRGNNVEVIISIYTQVSFSGSPYVFGQLPEGYRPPGTRFINCYGANVLIQILTGGTIVTYQSATNSILLGQCSYSL